MKKQVLLAIILAIILAIFLINLVSAGPASPNIITKTTVTSVITLNSIKPGDNIIFTATTTNKYLSEYDYKLIVCSNNSVGISCGSDYSSECLEGIKLCESENPSSSKQKSSCSYAVPPEESINWKAFTCNSNRDIGEYEQTDSITIPGFVAKEPGILATIKNLGAGSLRFLINIKGIILDLLPLETYTPITTCQELQDMQNDRYANYEILNNIDCSKTKNWNKRKGFIPITSFFGILEGNNYIISDLYIENDQAGLFYALCKNATVRNLIFTNVTINIVPSDEGWVGEGGVILGGVSCSSKKITITNVHVYDGIVTGGTDEYSGGLIGRVNYKTNLSFSSFEGFVEAAGGLVGQNDGQITNSSFIGTVDGTSMTIYAGPDFNEKGLTGGFTGWNFGTIRNSFSEGFVSGLNNVGGFVGGDEYVDETWRGEIFNSYSESGVEGYNNTAGFAGYDVGGNITNCYSWGIVTLSEGDLPSMSPLSMGLLAEDTNESKAGFLAYIVPKYDCINSYWDIETSGTTESECSVQGKTTAEMQNQSTYENWDFENIWRIAPSDYPKLIWEPIIITPQTTPEEFCNLFNPLRGRRNANRKACLKADWMGNEPKRNRPKDCYIEKNIRKDPYDDECLPTEKVD